MRKNNCFVVVFIFNTSNYCRVATVARTSCSSFIPGARETGHFKEWFIQAKKQKYPKR